MIHRNSLVFNFINFLLGCSAQRLKRPVAGVPVFVADICVVAGLMEPLSSFLPARLSAAAVVSLSSSVFRCCIRTCTLYMRDI